MDNKNNDDILAKWLDGTLDHVELQRLEQTGELDDLKRLMDDMEHWSLPDMDIESRLILIKEKRESKKPKQIFINNWLRIAAVFVILAASYFVFDSFSNQVDIVTGVGEQVSHSLPDGSVVTLDAMSHLSYLKNDWDSNRTVYFEGTGYFNVAKGDAFEVNSTIGSVKVLGTEFEIISNIQKYQVTCFEGKVAVHVGDAEEVLAPMDQYIHSQGRGERRSVSRNSPSWMQGYYKYSNVLLTEVLIDLKKQYDVKVDLPTRFQKIKFTGKVFHNNLEVALNSIFVPLEIPYSLDDNRRVEFY